MVTVAVGLNSGPENAGLGAGELAAALVAGVSDVVAAAGLDATSGRRGGQDWWIRVFQRLGLENAEIELKERYEQALRDGATAIAVLAPTEDRKDIAAKILAGCGAHFINYFGRLKVQRIGR